MTDTTPSWLAPLTSTVAQLGVPTVFAGVLLWFLLVEVGGTLKTIEQNEIDRTKLLLSVQETFVAAVQKQSELSAQLIQKLDYCKSKGE